MSDRIRTHPERGDRREDCVERLRRILYRYTPASVMLVALHGAQAQAVEYIANQGYDDSRPGRQRAVGAEQRFH